MQLPQLNFSHPSDFKFKKDKDRFFIYDVLRKSWVVLTPEEWVRQHWVSYFLHEKKYSNSALIIEKKIVISGVSKRIDLLVTEKTKAKILLECKAPSVKISQKDFEQIARYNSVLLADEIILSNGLSHLKADFYDHTYHFSNFNTSF